MHYNYTINDFLRFYLYVFDGLEVRLNQTLESIYCESFILNRRLTEISLLES